MPSNHDHPPALLNRLRRAIFFVQRHRAHDGPLARALLSYWLRQALRAVEAGDAKEMR